MLVYEPSIRVPLIMRGPGVPEGAHRRQLVTNADLAPTILEAAGAKPGKPQDGRSLFPLLEDRGLEWGRDLLIEGAPGVNQPAFDAIRTYRYVYVQHANGERELYDLERDPYQLTSLHNRPRLRGRAGGAGAAAGAAVGVRGPQLPLEAGRTPRRALVPRARVGHRGRDRDLPERAPPAPRPRAAVRLAGRRQVAARADSDERRPHRHAGPVAASALPLRAATGPSTRRV